MTSTPMTSLTSASSRPLVTRTGWIWIGVLSLLFVVLHATYLERLFRIVTKAKGSNLLELMVSAASSTWNPDWSHALVVPLISLYFLHQNRGRLAAASPRVSWWGLPALVVGMFGYAFWIFPGRNDMFQGYSMILALFGLVLLVLGPSMMRVLWFPIAYLVFAIKISDKLWEQIAWNLQHIAAICATTALKFFAVFIGKFHDVENRGSTIDLMYMDGGQLMTEPLNVAEACSGLRMLMAFVALGVALAFLWNRSWWQRLIMIVMAVPIAIAVNVGRVTILGLLFLVNKEMASGDFHTFIGMLMLIPAALLFVLLGWVLDRIIIRDEEAPDDSGPSTGIGASTLAADPEPPAAPRSGVAVRVADIAKGAGAGVGLILLAGLTYTLLLGSFRPELLFKEGTSRALMNGLLVIVALILVATVIQLPKLMPAAASTGAGHRRRRIAMSMVAGVLFTATVGQNAVVAATKAVLIKQPVPMRHALLTIPNRIGPWQMLKADPPLSKDQLDVLGTEKYINWWYVDTRVRQPGGIDLQRNTYEPGSVVRLHVAYYTGTTDTVPHVPDRCILAAGATGLGSGPALLTLQGTGYRPDRDDGGFLHPVQTRKVGTPLSPARIPQIDIDARRFTFGFGVGEGQVVENVIYFFAANGNFMASPEHVRLQGFDPRDKYAYYCKIEVLVNHVHDREMAVQRASDFLSDVLPEIMACLPDWVDVKEGRWPAADASVVLNDSLKD